MSALAERKYELENPNERVKVKKKAPINKNKKKNKPEKKINYKVVFNRVVLLGFVFSAIFFLIYNNSIITEKKLAIDNIENSIVLANNDIESYNIILENLNNTSTIESYATNYLGMSYPNRKQTILISVNYVDDKVETVKDVSFFDYILGCFIKE